MLLLAIGLFSSTFAAAEEIKLQCNYSTRISYQDGTIENESGLAIVEIDDQMPEFLRIEISAPGAINDVGVITLTSPLRKNIINLSDINKWDLSNSTTGNVAKGHGDQITGISIDRNTGGLIVRSNTYFQDGRFVLTTSSGNCVKVNNKTRKF